MISGSHLVQDRNHFLSFFPLSTKYCIVLSVIWSFLNRWQTSWMMSTCCNAVYTLSRTHVVSFSWVQQGKDLWQAGNDICISLNGVVRCRKSTALDLRDSCSSPISSGSEAQHVFTRGKNGSPGTRVCAELKYCRTWYNYNERDLSEDGTTSPLLLETCVVAKLGAHRLPTMNKEHLLNFVI